MSHIALGVAAFLAVTAFVIYPRPPEVNSNDLSCTMTFDLSTSTTSRNSTGDRGVVYWGDCATLRVSIVASHTRLNDAAPTTDDAQGAFINGHSIAEILGTFTVDDAQHTDTNDAQVLSKSRVTFTPSGSKDYPALDTGPSEFLLSRGR